MRIGAKDKKVIRAFLDRRSADGHKLSTDGERLDGHWIGGSHIVVWSKAPWTGGLTFHDLGSKAADTVQKAVLKMKDGPKRKRRR